MLNVVPRPLERGEDVDEKQREHEEDDQVEADIVPRGVVVWYMFAQHWVQKLSAKIANFSSLRPCMKNFIPEWLFLSYRRG